MNRLVALPYPWVSQSGIDNQIDAMQLCSVSNDKTFDRIRSSYSRTRFSLERRNEEMYFVQCVLNLSR